MVLLKEFLLSLYHQSTFCLYMHMYISTLYSMLTQRIFTTYFWFKHSSEKNASLKFMFTPQITFVAFCSFFPCSLTVFHMGRQQKSGGRQQKSSRADKQLCFPQGQTMKKLQSWKTEYFFFIFQPDFNIEIPPKNATKHPVAQQHDHAKHSG